MVQVHACVGIAYYAALMTLSFRETVVQSPLTNGMHISLAITLDFLPSYIELELLPLQA